MKFGIDAPWYDNNIERVAFNVYAMHTSNLDEIVNWVIENEIDEDTLQNVLKDYSDEDIAYVLNELEDRYGLD